MVLLASLALCTLCLARSLAAVPGEPERMDLVTIEVASFVAADCSGEAASVCAYVASQRRGRPSAGAGSGRTSGAGPRGVRGAPVPSRGVTSAANGAATGSAPPPTRLSAKWCRPAAATAAAEEDESAPCGACDDYRVDLTAARFGDMLGAAGTVVWNGPVGVFEIDQFGEGTKVLGHAIASADAFSIAGGGDTLAAIDKYGLAEKVSYISTGGGAFLEFLEGKTLPAVAALEQRARG